jgi:hypothetical protein
MTYFNQQLNYTPDTAKKNLHDFEAEYKGVVSFKD